VPHRDASWKDMPAEKKKKEFERLGMKWLQSHAVRAEVCAGCHIGAPADPSTGVPVRDMNHDFIAAGHPRLMFEYGSFLANEPKHWKEKDTRPDSDVRAWLVGQVVSSESALKLMIDRATTKDDTRVWPEFTEHDCYACHHDLARASWRQVRRPDRRPGAPPLSPWYYSLTAVLASTVAPDRPAIKFDDLMKSMSRTYPAPATVKKEAESALKSLSGLPEAMEKASWEKPAVARLRQKLVAHYRGMKAANWDELEQLALGLKSLESLEKNPEISSATNELLKVLAFPSEPDLFDSPHNFRKGKASTGNLNEILDKLK
jgi:hypothetical protein